jgi:limonene-1,2-epoxide hydrolase
MSANAERNVLEFLSLFDVETPDLDRMMTYLTPEARYLNRVRHAEPLAGYAAIKEELASQFSRYKDCDCNMISVASNGSQVFTERADTVTMRRDDRKVTVLVCAVFSVNDAGKITYWREYWDMGDIEAQLKAA